MKVENRKITDIKPYDKNPRDNDSAVEAVARSIREFGFRQPIVVDSEGVIVLDIRARRRRRSWALRRSRYALRPTLRQRRSGPTASQTTRSPTWQRGT